ncbi:MAG: hypothetical protein ACC707_15505, partial [Thiohalomonadales bacterium]
MNIGKKVCGRVNLWSGKMIKVVSVGAAGHLQLSAEVERHIARAEVIFGAEHQFSKLAIKINPATEIQ